MRYVLERRQTVNRPRGEVFAFFADAANLERLTPAALHFHILTPQPIELRAGAIIDYRIVLFGLPFRWRTLIQAFEPGAQFVDVQTSGPYAYWRHTHTFTDAAAGGTTIADHVEYALPFGPIGRAVHALVVGRQLRRIFDFRQKIVADIFRDG